MKRLLSLALLLAVSGCYGCGRTVHVHKEILDPDHSMGIVVYPVPVPEDPMPVPSWPPPKPLAEDGDPWCMNMLPGTVRS